MIYSLVFIQGVAEKVRFASIYDSPQHTCVHKRAHKMYTRKCTHVYTCTPGANTHRHTSHAHMQVCVHTHTQTHTDTHLLPYGFPDKGPATRLFNPGPLVLWANNSFWPRRFTPITNPHRSNL